VLAWRTDVPLGVSLPPPELAWAYCALVVLAAAAAVTDLRRGKIYNALTYPAIALGMIGHTLVGGITGGEGSLGLAGSLAGFATGFLPMFAAWMAGGVGGGDAKLMGAVGALSGWRFTLSAMFYGLLAALVLAIIVMVSRRLTRRTLGRVWRFLLLALVPRGTVDPATADSPKVPMGLAFALGVLAALAEALAGASGWVLGI